ncbi:hypothetical protein HYE69_07230 [Staphylococcus sp. GSSP0090]|nr:hypothetical protein [Staphylococcus sp. GSSP0090]
MFKRKMLGSIVFILALLCSLIPLNGNTYAATETHQSTDCHFIRYMRMTLPNK